MTADELKMVRSRIDAIWPPKKPPTVEEQREWVRFLQPLDGAVGLRTVDEMRDSLMFRPTMSDFKKAYYIAAALPSGDALALPAAPGEGEIPESLTDRYGHSMHDWVYCWRCDMALALAEMEDNCLWDDRRGLYHRRCPKGGCAPLIPTAERLVRDEYWRKMKITKEAK